MPNTTLISFYPKPRKNKAALYPPSRKKVTRSASNVKLNRFQREKSQLFQLVDQNLDAAFIGNYEPLNKVLEEWERGYLIEMITGMCLEILTAKKG